MSNKISNSAVAQKDLAQTVVVEGPNPRSEIEENQIERDRGVDEIHREEEEARARRGEDDENFSRDGAKELA